jgi:hypothetical protein
VSSFYFHYATFTSTTCTCAAYTSSITLICATYTSTTCTCTASTTSSSSFFKTTYHTCFQCHPKTPTKLPSSSTTSASPDVPAVDGSNNNIAESHIISDET